MSIRQLIIPALDGYRLAATLYVPRGRKRKAVVQLNSAIGIGRDFYKTYANFLASRGFHVVLYDYRGMGDSKDAGWEGGAPCLQDWGEKDLAGVIEWISSEFPQHRLVCVSHSSGGTLLGLAHNNWRVWAQLAIASHSGYWRNFSLRYWPRLWLRWFILIPLWARVLGRYPMHQSNYSEDLPVGVALDWARWCRTPGYISGERKRPEGKFFRNYRGRMRFYAFEDDVYYAPIEAVRALAADFDNADVQILRLAPEHLGMKQIGHFGFFSADTPEPAWQATVDWLLATVHANVRQSID
jgi:predicted alpha/beta hydrolase